MEAERFSENLRQILDYPPAQEVLRAILEESGALPGGKYSQGFLVSDIAEAAYIAGRKSIGIYLLDSIKEIAPQCLINIFRKSIEEDNA
jgi:hypothetical protein